jgi:short-subunit dehydrogenase
VNDTGAGTVLILGGRSEIGTELALRLAPGATVVLAARGADRLVEQISVVRAAGAAAVHTWEFDADDLDSHGPLVTSIIADALHGTGVRLLIVRPGFVTGRMTHGMKPAPLPSTPAKVAAATAHALAKRRRTVWIPSALQPLFFCARLLPQFVWRRMPR